MHAYADNTVDTETSDGMAFEDWNATFNLDWSFDYDTGFSLDFLVPGVIRVASLAAA